MTHDERTEIKVILSNLKAVAADMERWLDKYPCIKDGDPVCVVCGDTIARGETPVRLSGQGMGQWHHIRCLPPMGGA